MTFDTKYFVTHVHTMNDKWLHCQTKPHTIAVPRVSYRLVCVLPTHCVHLAAAIQPVTMSIVFATLPTKAIYNIARQPQHVIAPMHYSCITIGM